MTPDPTAWAQALQYLEVGDGEAAREILRTVRVPEGNTDVDPNVAVCVLLRSHLDPVPTRMDLQWRSDGSAADRVASSLDHARRASDALRSGRVIDLVHSARDARSAAPEVYTWLVFRTGSVLQAAFRFTADPDLLADALDTCGIVADRIDKPHLAIQARALIGNLHLLTGRFHAALESCTAALELAEVSGLQSHRVVAMAYQFRAYVLFEWNRLDEAQNDLEWAWALTDDRATGVRSGVARMLGRLHATRGDREATEQWIRNLEEVVREPMTLRNREWLAAVRLRVAADRADLRTVESWRRTYDYHEDRLSRLPDDEVPARLMEFDHLLAMLEATRQWPVILAVAPVVRAASERCRRWFHVRALTAEAVALEHLRRSEEADARFDEALSAGEVGSFVRVYLEGSPARLRLLVRALDRSTGVRHAQRVRDALPDVEIEAGVAPVLTPTQTHVMHLVAEGRSNKAIAAELGIEVTTVKSHLRSVYRRLSVGSRTQAVAEAHRLGLL